MTRNISIVSWVMLFVVGLCVLTSAEGKKYFKIPLDKCDGCGTCAAECPEGAITATKYNGKDVFVIDPVKCNACGVCSSVCIQQIIRPDSADISKEKKSDAKATGESSKKETKKVKGAEETNAPAAPIVQTGEKKTDKKTKYVVK